MGVTEEEIINNLAGHFRDIDGITAVFDFAENPDQLSQAMLPAVLFYPQNVDMEPRGHHNVWRNVFNITALVFVTPRESRAGKLRFLENQAISLIPSIRTKFQTESVVDNILNLGLVRGFINSINYGAGGTSLTHMGVEYIGLVVGFDFKERIQKS